ncbi:class I SAM-dependent methyltransferase [Streptomyces sp. NPDC057702]|uniref:class I SAM-dependent methyltransferase n=1 Tax=unclassified Streptomyces TaxID=2593676 RepID=UPI003693A33C
MTEPSYLRTTRAGYDAIAVPYADLARDDLANKPFDPAMLAAFAQVVRVGGGGLVADVGTGPGRIAAHLHGLGLDVFGVDLSPEMVALARRTYPELRFVEGAIAALDLADGALAGLVSWYSIIHTPPELMPAVFAEFHRVVAPGGHVMLAFQVGDEPLRLAEAFGHTIALEFHRWRPERVSELLTDAGFEPQATLVRAAEPTERTPQAYVMVRKPAVEAPGA